MPRDPDGTFQKAVSSFQPNTVILSDDMNEIIDDFVSDANTARPLAVGGTGGTSAETARTSLQVARAQNSVGDDTAGRGLIVGAFGLGSTGSMDETNFDDPEDRTQFIDTQTTSVTGAPDTQNVWNGLHMRKDTTAGWMMLANTEDVELKVRMETASTWGSWMHVPALYSFTSNSNGVAWRFTDGRQVCMLQTDTLASTTANGNLFISSTSTWTFPEAFGATTRLFITGSIRASVIGGFHLESAPGTTSCEWRRWTSTSSASTPVIVLRAEGTWR